MEEKSLFLLKKDWEDLKFYITNHITDIQFEADQLQMQNGNPTRHNYLSGQLIAMKHILNMMSSFEGKNV